MLQSPFPVSALNLPILNMAFATGAPAPPASPPRSTAWWPGGSFKEKPTILVWAGDGGTYDIGIQALSGAAERNTDFIYVCYNNEAYSNTGTQRSGATPYAAWTTNTTKGKEEWRKDIAQIMVAHGVPYVATASLAYPTDMYQQVRQGQGDQGHHVHRDPGALPAGLEVPLQPHHQGEPPGGAERHVDALRARERQDQLHRGNTAHHPGTVQAGRRSRNTCRRRGASAISSRPRRTR